MISGHQGFLTSRDQDAKTSIRIDFLISLFHDGLSSRFIHSVLVQFCSRCQLRERMVRLFRLAGEQARTGRDLRPVFGGQKHYMFCPRQAVFSVTRNRFRNRKQLARKGVELLRSRRFLPGPPWPDPKFGRRRIFETPSPENREDPAIFGEEKWRLIARIRLQNSPFSTDFRRLKMQNLRQISRIWTCFCALNSSS